MLPRTIAKLATAVACACAPMPAHHGSSQLDKTKPMTLTGVVTAAEWANPHVYIYVEVKDADGNSQSWAIECNNPNRLAQDGVKFVPKGTAISIQVYAPLPQSTLARNVWSPQALEQLKAGRYVAGGCAETSLFHQRLGYGPPIPRW